MYPVNIALVGNPNSGLTTVFNQMTDGVTHKGNYTTPSRMTKEGAVKITRESTSLSSPVSIPSPPTASMISPPETFSSRKNRMSSSMWWMQRASNEASI